MSASIHEGRIITITELPSMMSNTKILASQKYFGQFGTIQKLCIFQNSDGDKTAYIQYSNPIHASNAIKQMHLYRSPDTNATIKVHYNTDALCAMFLNQRTMKQISTTKEHQDPIQQTLYDIERTMFEEEISALKEEIQCIKRVLNEDQVFESQINELQQDNDRIRIKHCSLIRDFNILQQKYDKISDNEAEYSALRAMKVKHKELTRRCLWLQQQLEVMMCSNSELQGLVFNEVAPIASSSDCHDQVEGAVEDSRCE